MVEGNSQKVVKAAVVDEVAGVVKPLFRRDLQRREGSEGEEGTKKEKTVKRRI